MNAPTCPVDGHPYTDHPPGLPPTRLYLRARAAFITAMSHVITLPGSSDAHRAAISRARLQRQAPQ